MSQMILNYGDSDTFKSTNCGVFCDYQYERTGLPCYIVTADSGHGPMADQIKRGTAQVWNVASAKFPIAAMIWASKGHWPKVVDPLTGFAPVEKQTDMRPLKAGEVGGIVGEGLTRFAEMAGMSMTSAVNGVNISAPVKQFSQMGIDFTVADMRTSAGFIQKWTREYLANFKNLGVDRVLFTAHEAKGEDQISKKMVPGPAVTGKAVTAHVCGWFEFALHSEAYIVRGRPTPARRMWFQKHQDPDVLTAYWDAKLGCSPAVTAKILTAFPAGYIPLTMDMQTGDYISGIHSLLGILDAGDEQLQSRMIEEMREVSDGMQAATSDEGVNEVPGEEVQEVAPVVSMPAVSGGRRGRR